MITKPKGTYDLYGVEGKTFNYIEDIIKQITNSYNYEYLKTPIFEDTSLFHRGVGDTTDIVTKETYDFKDRGNRNLTLRPEGTAGVVRSFIENKLFTSNTTKKYWYLGNMYRYERPQSGRYREFLQFGCEAFGSDSPMLDAEIISIPVILFENLGLKKIKVNINSLGDTTSREIYKKALIEYFKPHIEELCDDCKERFLKNPLRILDCKVDKDNDILKNAPKTLDYLNEDSKKHFEEVLKYLNNLEINYEINPNIIRGLDYYTHTVFEIEANVEGFGSQNVMCGGGRYNELIKSLGGPDIPAVGFAIGIERLMKALEYEKITPVNDDNLDIYVIPIGEKAKEFAFSLNGALRLVGLRSDIDFLNKNISSNLKQADKMNARLAIIIGDEEIEGSYFTIRDMETKKDEKIEKQKIFSYIMKKLDSCCDDDCECD